MHDCTYYEDLCSAYIDGELNTEERTALEAHVAICPECAAFLEQLRDMQRLLAADRITLPSSLHEDIMELVLADAQQEAVPAMTKRRFVPVFSLLAAAAAAVMLVTTGTIGDLFTSGRSMVEGNLVTAADTGGAAGAAPAAAAEGAPVTEPDGVPAPNNQTTGGAVDAQAGIQSSATPQNDEMENEPQRDPADQSAAPGAGKKQAEGAPQPAAFSAAPAPAAAAEAPEAEPRAEAPSANANVAQPRIAMRGPAPMQVTLPVTPQAVTAQAYAKCYVAVGTGKLPEFEGVLVAQSEDGTAFYFTIQNNMSVLEKALAVLKDAGYEYERRETVEGLAFDEKAADALVIVLKNG